MKKRILSLLLAATMLLSLIPMTVFATGTSYAITNGTAQDANGSITVAETAADGDTVTVTVTPDKGYKLKSLVVLSAVSLAPPIIPAQDAQDETKYTFTMPDHPVIVKAEFQEKAITIADILPDDFPTCVDVLPPNLWVNGNEVNMMVIPSSLVIFTLDGDGNPDYVELANDIRTATLTKNGNNYTYTNNGVTTTFLMSNNGLESVKTEGLTGEYVDFNGTYGEQHTHSFTYTANGGKITATCTAGCDKGYDTTPLTLTLTAPASLVYDGNAKAFTFADGEADAWTGAGLELPTIFYNIKQSGQSTYLPLFGTLKSVGNYMAQITVGEKTAQAYFSIEAPHTHNPVKVTGKPATETAGGFRDYYECKDSADACHKYFEDATAKVEITDLDAWKAQGGNGYIAKLEKQTDPTDPKSPQTEDTSNMTLWLIMMALSSMGLCACLVLGKKRNKC